MSISDFIFRCPIVLQEHDNVFESITSSHTNKAISTQVLHNTRIMLFLVWFIHSYATFSTNIVATSYFWCSSTLNCWWIRWYCIYRSLPSIWEYFLVRLNSITIMFNMRFKGTLIPNKRFLEKLKLLMTPSGIHSTMNWCLGTFYSLLSGNSDTSHETNTAIVLVPAKHAFHNYPLKSMYDLLCQQIKQFWGQSRCSFYSCLTWSRPQQISLLKHNLSQ